MNAPRNRPKGWAQLWWSSLPLRVLLSTLTLSMLKSRYSAVPEPVKVSRSEKLHFSVLQDIARKFLEGAPTDDDSSPAPSLTI